MPYQKIKLKLNNNNVYRDATDLVQCKCNTPGCRLTRQAYTLKFVVSSYVGTVQSRYNEYHYNEIFSLTNIISIRKNKSYTLPLLIYSL